MNNWILSIISITVLICLLDLFMSEGKTKKYIKGIMSIVVMAVIIAPLPKFLKSEISIMETFNEQSQSSTYIDEEYLFRLFSAEYNEKERQIERILSEKGIKYTEVKINLYHFDGKVNIINVLILMQKSVITVENKNININDMIVEVVKAVSGVSQEQIIIYGKDN